MEYPPHQPLRIPLLGPSLAECHKQFRSIPRLKDHTLLYRLATALPECSGMVTKALFRPKGDLP